MLKPLIIDSDPGQDDAIAILVALASSEHLKILGITTVAGNVSLDLTQRNARLICDLAGRNESKIYAGCSRPLIQDLVTAEDFHGATGLDGIEIYEPDLPLQEEHAVDFIIKTLLAASENNITIVGIGPLTNIALAMIREPKIIPKIAEIVIMGGSVSEGGNITPAAEFNIYTDPHAADIVFKSGCPLVIIGLDATHKARATEKRLAKLYEIDTPVSKMAKASFKFISETYLKAYNQSSAPCHDALTIAYLINPDLFKGVNVNVAVEINSGLTLGATVVDYWHVSGRAENAYWITDVDADGIYELIIDRIARFKK